MTTASAKKAASKAKRAGNAIVADLSEVKAEFFARAKKENPQMTAAQLAANWRFVKKQLGL